MTKPYTLYAAKGGGSMIVEAAFGFTKLPLTIKDVSWNDLGWESKALKRLNPLGQVPTLILPNGGVMTESVAIFLHLADRVKIFPLVPAPGHRHRAPFLRYLVFLAAAVYPTFTYGDVPERWVGMPKDKGAGKALRNATDDHRKVLLRFLEGQCTEPLFLGRTLSALDVFIWVLAKWRPGKDWLKAECPRLFRIATAMDNHEVCKRVAARNGI